MSTEQDITTAVDAPPVSGDPIAEAARARQFEWETHKLLGRVDRALNGFHISVCAAGLAEMFYRVLTATGADPVEAAGNLIALAHARNEATKQKGEESTP